jgi:hypothetical protein
MKLELHPAVEAQLDWVVARPGGSVLLHGPKRVGKTTAAVEIARRLNCIGCTDESCRSCMMVAHGNHPDIILIKPDDKGKIGIDAVHELQHKLTYSEYESKSHRVVIISDADKLTLPAENSLLKTLEEPPTATTMILTAVSPAALLETTVSRCRVIYQPKVSDSQIENFINGLPQGDINQNELSTIVSASHGAPGRAYRLFTDPQLREENLAVNELLTELMTTSNLFERLVVATEIASNKSLDKFDPLESLTGMVRRQVRSTSAQQPNLSAVERLRRRINSNVPPRAAYEAFALEVMC